MPSLRKDLRDKLETTVVAARVAAEIGAREALAALGVDQGKAFEHLKPDEKVLRNRLRARGRQAGDILDDRSGKQTIDHLVQIVAYAHWHRMLFARFLAENGFLLEPDNQVAVSLADVSELARDVGIEVWELAGRFAQRMLPGVFRADDPVLALTLARETRTKLEKLVADLARESFLADDSLGWTYEYWQQRQKKEVSEAMKGGLKVGGDQISPVTQLFTEDYIVDFVLHNTLGAWWAHKIGPIAATSEEAARELLQVPAKSGLPAITWTYLRLVKDEAMGTWTPAAGTFSSWPNRARNITFLDPSMGSGHFVVFALPILARLRMEEENLDAASSVNAVLHDNIYGLELDERCTQIAAFNLALAGWRLAGYQALPVLHIACSGLAPNASEAVWVALAGDNLAAQNGMARLHRLFRNAPVLGSLINPRSIQDELLSAEFHELRPLLERALAHETKDDAAHEMVVTARGLAKAAEILSGEFTLVATNVPYLGNRKQGDILKQYCERVHPDAKADLANCFVERCMEFCTISGSAALVTPQNWLFLGNAESLRRRLLEQFQWNSVAILGEHAFESSSAAGAFVALVTLTRQKPAEGHAFTIGDASVALAPEAKAEQLRLGPLLRCIQRGQLKNPDARIAVDSTSAIKLLEAFTDCPQGIKTGDDDRWRRCFWELPVVSDGWEFYQSTVEDCTLFAGREFIIDWRTGGTGMVRPRIQNRAVGRFGVAISQMRQLPATLYTGERFDSNVAAIVPAEPEHLLPLWCFCSSPEFNVLVRKIDRKVSVTNATLTKIPFDLAHWKMVAEKEFPHGLPKPFSTDPTQWLFNGRPNDSDEPLHVATVRLLGYQWPRLTGSNFPDCPALGADGFESHADVDGIVCLSAVHGERSGADRLRTLLSASLGNFDEPGLVAATGSRATSLESWLRDDFFDQHCVLFHSVPFIWHVWDGRSDGFHALVNYHKLAAPHAAGRKLLELLTFAYLGDWIKKQRDEQKKPGAEDRLIAAETLQRELKTILAGEPPCDLFVRWKPLHQQPIGWEPDLNDGVCRNIRPFLSAKDVGRKGAGILRSKPNINWEKDRGNEPMLPKVDYPWFWSRNDTTENFAGGAQFDGKRWNDSHYTPAFKRAARDRANAPRK